MIWNVPNTLTWIRIAAIPLIVLLFLMPYPWADPAAGLLFTAAGITDSLDGYLARRLGRPLVPVSGRALPRGRGVDRERVHAAGELARERLVDHAMAFDPALSAEGLRHNIKTVMRLPARAVTRMAGVLMGFVHHPQGFGRKSGGQLLGDDIGYAHRVRHGSRLAHIPAKWKPVRRKGYAQNERRPPGSMADRRNAGLRRNEFVKLAW